MKHNKLKAFTLAELLVLLLTLSILMAAFAPVFTKRFNNVTSDEVWSFIIGDDQKNAYYDSINKTFTSQAFVGLTPVDGQDVAKMVEDEEDKPVYSKLVVAASKKLGSTSRPQHQMVFRHGDSDAGTKTAGLFAGNGNMLIGNASNSITNGAINNTSFGANTLNALKDGKNNTAIGKSAFGDMNTGSGNTGIGVNVGAKSSGSTGHTVIGANAAFKYPNCTGSGVCTHNSAKTEYSTVIGTLSKYGTNGSYNTIIGYKAGNVNMSHANTAVGALALGGGLNDPDGANEQGTVGSDGDLIGNTAVGYNTLGKLKKGHYNTAIGANACSLFDSSTGSISGKYISKVTCIGADSVSSTNANITNSAASLISHARGKEGEVPDRVFLGSFPQSDKLAGGSGAGSQPFAVVEVHNSVKEPNVNLNPMAGGEESVIINGNLVVRGQTYLEAPIFRYHNATKDPILFENAEQAQMNNTFDPNIYPSTVPKGLMLFRTVEMYEDYDNIKVFSGYDGSDRDKGSVESCRDRGCRNHAFADRRPNCICTAVGPTNKLHGKYQQGYYSTSAKYYTGIIMNRNTTYRLADDKVKLSSTSYDWASASPNMNGYKKDGAMFINQDCYKPEWGPAAYYYDLSEDAPVYLSRQKDGQKDLSDPAYETRESDAPFAHLRETACCPNLSEETTKYQDSAVNTRTWFWTNDEKNTYSDKRLKDVGERFTAGLDEIKKLNIYHYTYKNDKNKLPHVGVVAQDLKRVFPTAVTEDKDGYYKIRWDEMLYAAVNAIKTLNSKIVNLADKVVKTQERIANLKKDNAELYAQLDTLANELTVLESKRK